MESNDLNEIQDLITTLKQDKEVQELLTEFVGRQAEKSTGPAGEILKKNTQINGNATTRLNRFPVTEIQIDTY